MGLRLSKSMTVTGNTAQATTPLLVERGGIASLSIIGTSFVGTITCQRRLDGTNWADVDSWTVDTEKDYYASEAHEVRLICKSGDYTSGSAVIRVGK